MTVSKCIFHFSIIAFILLTSCYKNVEGCLDPLSKNYALGADVGCNGCCIYPDLTLKIKHYVGDSLLLAKNLDTTLTNTLGQEFRLVDVRFYLSEFTIFQKNFGNKILDKLNTGNNFTTIENDMKIVRFVDNEIVIGKVKLEGKFDSLSLHLGLSRKMLDSTFLNLPTGHVLTKDFKLTGDINSTALVKIKYYSLAKPKDTLNLSFSNKDIFIKTTLKNPISSSKGNSIFYPIAFDYLKLFENVDLTKDKQSIQLNMEKNFKSFVFQK